jgi:Domain of unknown function (DUF4177)
MQKWEYKIVDVAVYGSSVDNTTEKINDLGGQGWELVAAVPDDNGIYARLIFKRLLN